MTDPLKEIKMKKHISILASALAVLSLASCSKDTEGLTQVTYYAVIDLEGPTYDQATAGKPYQDPGYSASMQGEDITDQVQVKTSMNLSDPQPGFYTLTYEAINEDGFPATATRYVLVSDEGDDASGYWTTDATSYRDNNGIVYFGGYQVIIYGNGDGTYHVSDLLGGWYEFRAGYGSAYACVGEIGISDDGKISMISSSVAGWGDSASALSDGVFDASAKTMSWVVTYAGMNFHVNLSK